MIWNEITTKINWSRTRENGKDRRDELEREAHGPSNKWMWWRMRVICTLFIQCTLYSVYTFCIVHQCMTARPAPVPLGWSKHRNVDAQYALHTHSVYLKISKRGFFLASVFFMRCVRLLPFELGQNVCAWANWREDVMIANEKKIDMDWHVILVYDFFCHFYAFHVHLPLEHICWAISRDVSRSLSVHITMRFVFHGPCWKHLCVTTIHYVITMNWFKRPELQIFRYILLRYLKV